jgi:hypothetical protein
MLSCPKCKDHYEVDFDNVEVGGFGLLIIFKCKSCGEIHQLGGSPNYRKLDKTEEIDYANTN